MVASPSDTTGLAVLELELARETGMLAYPSTSWTRDTVRSEGEISRDTGAVEVHEPRPADPPSLRDATEFDVVIIGAGQSGLTTAVKLRREGVERVLIIDRASAGFEGPWGTWARMRTLRTAKELHGPDAGYPSATFRSWFTAQFGEQAWRELGLIPRIMWLEYLGWIRRVFGLTVRNGAEVTDIEPDTSEFSLTVREKTTVARIRTRRLVLCTGTDGVGGAVLPGWVAEVNSALWRHSSDVLPLDALDGKRVAVLGGGASAFDNAAAALEVGANVVQFVRRDRLPTINGVRPLETRAIFRHFDVLPDVHKVEIARRSLTLSVPPPIHSIDRCTAHANYELRFGTEWVSVRERDGRAVIMLADGSEEEFDLLILGTGFDVDLTRVHWLRTLLPGLATWADRADLGTSAVDSRLARYPYLGRGLSGTARTQEAEQWAPRIHFLNNAAVVSGGPAVVGINGLPMATDQVVDEICRSLLAEDSERITTSFLESTVERERNE